MNGLCCECRVTAGGIACTAGTQPASCAVAAATGPCGRQPVPRHLCLVPSVQPGCLGPDMTLPHGGRAPCPRCAPPSRRAWTCCLVTSARRWPSSPLTSEAGGLGLGMGGWTCSLPLRHRCHGGFGAGWAGKQTAAWRAACWAHDQACCLDIRLPHSHTPPARSTLHFYNLKSTLSVPQQMVVAEIDDPFVPLPDDLLVRRCGGWREVCGMRELLAQESSPCAGGQHWPGVCDLPGNAGKPGLLTPPSRLI